MATNSNYENRFNVDPKDPQIIKEAAKLAGILVEEGKAARVLLNYNRKTSTIDDVKIEINKIPIDVHTFARKYAYDFGAFDPKISTNKILINKNQIYDLLPNHTGYNRALLFYSMVILHETAHFKHFNYNENTQEVGGEAGEDLETRLVGGVLDLNLDDEGNLVLQMNDATISSPVAIEHIRKLKDEASSPIVATTSVGPTVDVELTCTFNPEERKLKICLRNPNETDIKVPKSFNTTAFFFKLQVNERSISTRRCTKRGNVPISDLENLAHNQVKVYEFDDFFDHFQVEKDEAITCYQIECHFCISTYINGSRIRYLSNTCLIDHKPIKQCINSVPVSSKINIFLDITNQN